MYLYFNGNLDFKTPTYLTILPGLRSKFFLTISVSSVDVFDDVPKLKTVIERGSATPMAYDTWTRQRRQRPALTKDLATHLWKKGGTIRNWQNTPALNTINCKYFISSHNHCAQSQPSLWPWDQGVESALTCLDRNSPCQSQNSLNWVVMQDHPKHWASLAGHRRFQPGSQH